MTRVLFLIPDVFKNYCYKHNKDIIPTMKIIEIHNGAFKVTVDRKCPCECDTRFETFYFENEQILDGFITNSTSQNEEEGARWYVKHDFRY